MKPPRLAVLGPLGALALLLSCDEEPCAHEALNATFAVQGNCGPEGLLHLTAPMNRCDLEASGAEALGLPSTGRIHPMEDVADAALYDLLEGPWELSGERPGTGSGWRRCETTREAGGLRLHCEDSTHPPGDSEAQAAGRCEALLTPR